jgi:6-phosphogluconolactonase
MIVYVSISGENQIAVFRMEPQSGKLTAEKSVSVGGKPTPLAVDPRGRFLFVGMGSDRRLASYRINRSWGKLSFVGDTSAEAESCYLSTDRRGRFLLSAYFRPGKVAVHSIGEQGVLGDTPVHVVRTAESAHCIQTDRTNRFAFVPHTRSDAIYQFEFDETSGRLAANDVPKMMAQKDTAPRHLCFHPFLDIAYVVNEMGSSVTACRYDGASGTLTAGETISTLPNGYKGESKCSQIRITPSGEFLYAANRGHGTIACFAVDSTTGKLSSVGQVRTEAIPRAFELDPEGRFLLAAGIGTGRLATYCIDSKTGRLSPVEVHDLGAKPMWVIVVPL